MTDISEETFSLLCSEELPDSSEIWIYADDDTINDPLDIGKRLPLVYGKKERVPGIGWQVGSFTTLVSAVAAGVNNQNIKVSSTKGFPAAGTFEVRVDAEDILMSTVSDTVLNIETGIGSRGRNGTTDADHVAGSGMTELIATIIYCFSCREADAINEVYILNPFNDEIFRVDLVLYGHIRDVQDKTTIPGETICTIRFTQAQLKVLLDALFVSAQAQVEVQPDFESPAETIQMFFNSWVPAPVSFTDATFLPFNHGHLPIRSDAVSFGAAVSLAYSAVAGDDESFWMFISTGSTPNPDRIVSRWRYVIRVSSITSDTTDLMTIEFNANMAGNGTAHHKVIAIGASQQVGGIVVGSWVIPSVTKDVGDLERTTPPSAGSTANSMIVFQWNSFGGGGTGGDFTFIITSSYIEVELEPVDLDQTTLTVVSGGGMATGYGLRFFADIDGVPAPHFQETDAAFDAVMEKPADIMRHWIESEGKEVMEDASFDRMVTNLGTMKWGVDARDMGFSWSEVLQRMAYEARTNIVPEQVSIPVSIFSFDSQVGDWSGINSAIADEATIVREGSGSISVPSNGTDLFHGFQNPQPTMDLTDKVIVFWIYTPAGTAANQNTVDLIISSNPAGGNDFRHYQDLGRNVSRPDGWSRQAIHVDSNQAETGTLDLTDVKWWRFGWIQFVADAGDDFYFDDCRVYGGREWRALLADAAYEWPAPVAAISEWTDFKDERRDLIELGTRHTYRYDLDATMGRGGQGADAFRKVVVASPDVSDVSVTAAELATARERWGAAEYAPRNLLAHNDEVSAEATAGYYVHEAIALDRSLFRISGVPLYQGFNLQVGDIIEVVPPWRNLGPEERVFSFDNGITLWNNSSSTLFNEGTLFVEGVGSMLIRSVVGSIINGANLVTPTALTTKYDVRNRSISFWAYATTDAHANLNNAQAFHIALGNTSVANRRDYLIHPDVIPVANVWTKIVFDTKTTAFAGVGSPDMSRVDWWGVAWLQQSDVADEDLYVDDLRIVNTPTKCRIIELSKDFSDQWDMVLTEVP